MMIYKIFITEDSEPKSGLSPSWQSLFTLDGDDKTSLAPVVSEIGGGWYKFSIVYGSGSFTTAELVGVIDAGASLGSCERYLPVTISLRDLALAKLVNPASYDLVEGIEDILSDDEASSELTIQLSQEGNVEYRRTI
jgi:hypothetical protein